MFSETSRPARGSTQVPMNWVPRVQIGYRGYRFLDVKATAHFVVLQSSRMRVAVRPLPHMLLHHSQIAVVNFNS